MTNADPHPLVSVIMGSKSDWETMQPAQAMLAQFGVAEGVDVSTEALEFCRERGISDVKQGAAESLPYEDASFDLVTGLDVV
jgi:ubiquinone/menaquinone biosynthesis C-methylase UbiE